MIIVIRRSLPLPVNRQRRAKNVKPWKVKNMIRRIILEIRGS